MCHTHTSKNMSNSWRRERTPLRSLRLRNTITSSPTVTPTRDLLGPTLQPAREMTHLCGGGKRVDAIILSHSG